MQTAATPMHEAAFNDFEEAAELLLEAGCEADMLNVVSGFHVVWLREAVVCCGHHRCCWLTPCRLCVGTGWPRADSLGV